jgi:hypothetical protein
MDWWILPLAIIIIVCLLGIPIIDYLKDVKLEKSRKDLLDKMIDGYCNDCDKNFSECQKCGKCLKENYEKKFI